MDDGGTGCTSQAILPEVQTPPPEETPPTPSEVPGPEDSPSQEVSALSVDTLTPPPDAETVRAPESSVTDEGGVQRVHEVTAYKLQYAVCQIHRVILLLKVPCLTTMCVGVV